MAMAPIVDSQFWNQETESSRAVDGVVHTLPYEPPPLGLLRSNRLLRSQQLLLLQEHGSFPVTPSFSDGALSLDSVIAVVGGLNWWTTLTARMQTHGIVNILREESQGNRSTPVTIDGWAKAKQLFCHSMNALGMHTRACLGSNTSLSASCEMDDGLARLLSCNYLSGDSEKPWHAQASLRHKMQQHDFLVAAAWNDKCVDRRGRYWNVPDTVSLDLLSCNPSGLRYRVGVHHSSGVTEPSGEAASALPFGALAGVCGRAAVFLEKEINLWKDTQNKPQKPFNLLASHPHFTISGIMGGILTVDSLKGGQRRDGFALKPTSPIVSADAFASVGLSAQLGHFQRWFLDFSKLDACINVGSAAALVAAASNSENGNKGSHIPTLEVTLQQQVSGPIRARMDARFGMESLYFKKNLQVQDIAYGFDWSPESSGSLKVVVWYSPMRNEGMMEFRLLEK